MRYLITLAALLLLPPMAWAQAPTDCTFHITAAVPDDLWNVHDATAPYGSTQTGDGGTPATWQDTDACGTNDWALDFNGADPEPTFRDPGSLLQSSVEFDGSLDHGESWDNAATAYEAISTFIDADSFMMAVVLHAQTINASNANVYLNDGVIVDQSGFVGILLQDNGGVGDYEACIYNWDGTADSACVDIDLNTTYLVTANHTGGNIRIDVFDGPGSSVGNATAASGNTTNITATMRIGANYNDSQQFDGFIGEVWVEDVYNGTTYSGLDDDFSAWFASTSAAPFFFFGR